MSSEKNGVILVVDDSRFSLMHIMQILQDDYIVHGASSGIEAIQVAKVAKPDLVLMDIIMPQIDGYETLFALRSITGTGSIPVIFITSLGQDINEERGLKLGAVDYIVKPYNPSIVKLRVALHVQLMRQVKAIRDLKAFDSYTGLGTRRHFEAQFEQKRQQAAMGGKSLGLLHVDIDGLGEFNAAHGNKFGDKALLKVAMDVAAHTESISARWGDDCFALLLEDAGETACFETAEAIRKGVENYPFVLEGDQATNITVSIGAGFFEPAREDVSLEHFAAKVDAALRQAKKSGKNRVVVNS